MSDSAATVLPEPDSPTMPSGLAAVEREAHAVDGLDDAGVREEVRREVLDREEAFGHAYSLSLGSVASRRPLPNEMKPKTVVTSARLGNSSHPPATGLQVVQESEIMRPHDDVRRLDADAQEAQGRLGDDGAADAHGDGDVDRRHAVGQHVAEDDAQVARALGARRLDELHGLHAEDRPRTRRA